MQLSIRRAHDRGPALELRTKRPQRASFEIRRHPAGLFQYEEAGGHVEHPDRDRSAERVEAAGCGVRYRERHRTEDTDLARALDEAAREIERSRRALERHELETAAGRGHDFDRLASAPRALASDRGPGLTVDQVDDAACERIADGRPIEQRQPHAEEGDPLLGVEAPVDRVDQPGRVLGPERAMTGFLGEDGKALTASV